MRAPIIAWSRSFSSIYACVFTDLKVGKTLKQSFFSIIRNQILLKLSEKNMPLFPVEYPVFFTATNLEWKKLLKADSHKDIIINSLRFLVTERRINLFAFVIMDNHIHIIWQMLNGHKRKDVQRDFLKYTAQKLKKELSIYDPAFLEMFYVNAKDRKYQFWERNPLHIELWNSAVFNQKLSYIHWNPVRKGICSTPEEYKYSSAAFYHTGIDNWGFLSHAND